MEIKQHTKNKQASMVINPAPTAIDFLDSKVRMGSAKKFESGNYLLNNFYVPELKKLTDSTPVSTEKIQISVGAISGELNHPYRLQGGKLNISGLDCKNPIEDGVSEVTKQTIDGKEVIHNVSINLRKAHKALKDGKEINFGDTLKRAFFQHTQADTEFITI